MEADVKNYVFNASSAWLLMGKGYRISRSIRLQWFLQHIDKVVVPKSQEEICDSNEELEVLSVVDDLHLHNSDSINEGSSTSNSSKEHQLKNSVPDEPMPLRVVPTTRLTFIARQYRFVYCIDMSPSLATVDTETGNVLVDDMFKNLVNSLTALVQPFCVENSSYKLTPKLFITVLAHTYTTEKECQVLIQGFSLNQNNVTEFLARLRKKLETVLERLIQAICDKKKEDTEVQNRYGQTSLFHMIRDSLLSLQLLPDNASASIVVVTDGVFMLDNAHLTDALLNQCRNTSAVVSFLQVGSGYRRPSVGLGFVPHCALMQFIATSTSGAYLVKCPMVKKSTENHDMNMYQKALFCWYFQRDLDRSKVSSYIDDGDDSMKDINHLFTWGDIISLPSGQSTQTLTVTPQHQQTMGVFQHNVPTKILRLLSMRAREGYILDSIRFPQKQDQYQIEVKLVWPWKEHVAIEYIAKSDWPLLSNQTNVVVNVTGPYEFLVDIALPKQKNRKGFRNVVLQRFEYTMKSLEMSDSVLVQLQSFSTQENAFRIPSTISDKMPLFAMSPNYNEPVIAVLAQYGSHKAKRSNRSPDVQFANFWKCIVVMDTKIWSKWFHCHRVSILLEHDRPITKELFVPLSSGQYPTVSYRAASSSFNRLLKEWCDLILLENHSYVKFMHRPESDRPYTFCVLRLTFKGICIIIQLAFLLGTPGKERSKVTEDLKMKLSNMSAVIERPSQKEDLDAGYRSPDTSNKPSEIRQQKCAVFMSKQVQRILIKYENVPDQVRSSAKPFETNEHPKSNVVEEKVLTRPYQSVHDSGTPVAVLGRYLFDQRWVWNMVPAANISFDTHCIAQILNTIMKQRLYEGFHFCSNAKGIVTMAKEVNVSTNYSAESTSNCCIIQYVIFPPHQKLLMKIDSTESDNVPHETEDGDLQMVNEVWVEPQMGVIDEGNKPLSYLNGVEYSDIPAKMFEVDSKIVMEISSYILLHKACFNNIVNEKIPERGAKHPPIPRNAFISSSTVQVPFLFDLVPLMYKSKLIVSLYPMMKNLLQESPVNKNLDPNDVLLGYLFKTLEHMNDLSLKLSAEENELVLRHLSQRCNDDSRIWEGHQYRQQQQETSQKKSQSEQQNSQHLEQQHLFTISSHSNDHEIIDVACVNFKCFVKSFGSTIIILILPASVKDVQVLVDGRVCETVEESYNKRRNLPFFIFECEYQNLKNVPSLSCTHYHSDMFQDYSGALNESDMIPRHINQKLPDERSKEIALYCQAIYDHYFWALVSGVYDCLKNRFILDAEDVESSIELFCEESTKEIEITSFLRTLCNHYRSNTLILDPFACDDIVFPTDVGNQYSLQPENKPLSRLQKRSSSGSSSFRSSRTSLRLKNGECDNLAIAEEIKLLFIDILNKYFEHVPNDLYYMFFDDKTDDDDDEEEENEDDDADADCDSSSQENSSARSSVTIFNLQDFDPNDSSLSPGPESDRFSPTFLQDETINLGTNNNNTKNVNSGRNNKKNIVYINTVDTKDKERPMFLHLTCTVHYRTKEENIMKPISVSSLPTCLGEIFNQLNEHGRNIDPYSDSLSVTLDLVCLSQPSEPEEDEEWKVPKDVMVLRQRSDSFYSSHSQGSRDSRGRSTLLSSVSREDSYMRQASDTIENLPKKQRDAVEKICEDLQWLLEDEITSAFRTQISITDKTLDRIAKHIQNSPDSPNCIFERKVFNFVTGLEKVTNHSTTMFVVELESANMEYNLKRVGKYYCVVGNIAVEEESDVDSLAVLEEVKEKAKETRKNLGHRRSQSDFTTTRKKSIEKVHDPTKRFSRRLSKSWPIVYDRLNADVNYIYDMEQNNDTTNILRFDSPWNGKEDNCSDVLFHIRHVSTTNSSKENSTISPYPYDEGEVLQRSMSCSEQQKDEKHAESVPRRRNYSLPNIHNPVMTEDETLVAEGSSTNKKDNHRLLSTKLQQHQHQEKDRLQTKSLRTTEETRSSQRDVDSVVYEDDQMVHPHPHFWLFMEITEESVNVYLHHRQTEEAKNVENYKCFHSRLMQYMDQICKIVNQRSLLEHLYSTHTVHSLLLAADEETVWNTSDSVSDKDMVYVVHEPSSNKPFPYVIHGEYKFQPGFFECDVVWQQRLSIHNRLTATSKAGGMSKAMLAVRSGLAKFQAQNRDNVFVIKEQEMNNIVYIRLSQGTSDSSRMSFDEEDDRLFRPVSDNQSRASTLSLAANSKQESEDDRFDFERQDSYHSQQFMASRNDDKSSISDTLVPTQDCIIFSVHGIREPGKEIKVDVMSMVIKKLDNTTLDLINQHIARNPQCKLTPQDVEFIQPSGMLPTRQLQLCVTEFASKYLHAIMFYFHQHLLKKYNTPRYTTDDPMYQFKNYTKRNNSRNTAEPLCPNSVYLYNRRDKADIELCTCCGISYATSECEGCIGIVYVKLCDRNDKFMLVHPCYPSSNDSWTQEDLSQAFVKLLKFKRYEELVDEDHEFVKNIKIKISIWENGVISLDEFEKDLLHHLQNALCDVFLEYFLLSTPLCEIPCELQHSHISSRRDSVQHQRSSFSSGSHVRSNNQSAGSSTNTTPKFGRQLGKRYSSEPGTPSDGRAVSPASISKVTGSNYSEDLKLVSEIASSLPRDEFEERKDGIPQKDSKRNSPIVQRISPMIKKDSPNLHRKLSGRDSSPMLQKQGSSSRTSSVRSESELTTPLPDHTITATDGGTNISEHPKTITMNQLNQIRVGAMTDMMSNDPEVSQVIGESDTISIGKKATWQDVEIQRRLEVEKMKERRKHEHGIKGNLHINYHKVSVDVFETIVTDNNPSVHKQVGSLRHRYPMETVMNEFAKEMKDKCPDIIPKMFQAIKMMDGRKTFCRYTERSAVKTTEEGESSMEHGNSVSIVPGESPEYIVVGHNAHKWSLSMGTDEDDLSDQEEGKSNQEQNGKLNFKPLRVHNLGSSNVDRRNHELEHPSCIAQAFVPRQKFFIAFFRNKKITLFTYNFITEVYTNIDRQLKRLYAWHNVRTHLNACLFTQKLGLFHHNHFVRDCPDKNDPEVASFSSSSNHNNLYPLMRAVSPRAKDKHKQEHQNPVGVPIPEFDDTFRDIIPTKPLHRCSCFTMRDLVKRQAWQLQDLRNLKLHIAYQEARLREIFDAWKQEGAHVPITEEKLHLLKRRSLFLHYCDAPVLFKNYDCEGKEVCPVKNVLKLDKDESATENDTGHKQSNLKDDWYEDLKWTLVQQYIQYLQTLGLCLVQITTKSSTKPQAPPAFNRTNLRNLTRQTNRSFDGKDVKVPDHRPSVYHLQKTTNGGIILMDVFFKRSHLCYKMSAFQLSSLNTMTSNIAPKDERQFSEDCNKFKDLTHLRSFTYDFHIREIQKHLSRKHSRFPRSYPVHKLMVSIITEYPKPPRFCRCILTDGYVSIPCTPGLTPATVYNYLALKANIYNLIKIPAVIVSDESTGNGGRWTGKNNILTYSYCTEKEPIQFPESWRTRRDKTEYDGNVTLHFVASDNVGVIELPFFVCLGNRKEFYPRPHVLSNVSSLKPRQRMTSTFDSTYSENEMKVKSRVRFSGPQDSQGNTMHEVHSTGSIRRLPSNNSGLLDSVSSIRSTESDTSLSSNRNFNSPRISPGRSNQIFKMSPDQHLSGGSPDSDASSEAVNKVVSLTSTQETYFINELKFMSQEIIRVREHLSATIGRCISNCWRDLQWRILLTSDMKSEESEKRGKKKSSSECMSLELMRRICDWEESNIIDEMLSEGLLLTYSSIKRLLNLVNQYRMELIEKRISESYFYVHSLEQKQLIKNLLRKYGPLCRTFVSENGLSTYVCILNSNNLDMFYLIESKEEQGLMEFSVVYRTEPTSTPLECKNDDDLTTVEKNSRLHIQNVHNFLCYNLWLQLLPT